GGTAELDVGPRGIEVGVADEDLAGTAEVAVHDALGSTTLVGGQHVRHAGELLHGAFHAHPGTAAGVGLVAFHDAGPLVGAHGTGAAVGHQVDDHVRGAQQKGVVVRLLQQLHALGLSAQADGLNALDAEGLDDGTELHGSRLFELGLEETQVLGLVHHAQTGDAFVPVGYADHALGHHFHVRLGVLAMRY